ncbi:MAG: TIGR03915 family putative DNA repair protein [Lachnospiraceae bacterium]|nr:TIGR03915 family putative DNA repair protein [Lachnospiraceae bacterium]
MQNPEKKYIYLCENSIEGIFSAVNQAWEGNHGHSHNKIELIDANYNNELFSEYIEVETNLVKAEKVLRTIRQKVSEEFCEQMMMTSLSYDNRKADIIYRSIILGLYMGKRVLAHLADENISMVEKLTQNITKEVLHFYGFLRFEELKNGLLLGRIKPKNNLIRLLGDHFSDRFPEETFLIADTRRSSFFIHTPEHSEYFTYPGFDFMNALPSSSEEEKYYQELWCKFVDTIAIKPRANEKLQKQMLPLRFRDYMPEFSTSRNFF